MTKQIAHCALAMFLSAGATGCGPVPYFQFEKSKQGAAALLDAEVFEEIDLALLLDPTRANCNAASGGHSDDDGRRRLECAFATFYGQERVVGQKLRRNRVQDRLIAASNQRCADYKQHVRRFDATNNTVLGVLTTTSAGMGAILTHADTVRALSGAAAIASGIRAELNETYFQQNTIQVIANGFERRREVLRKAMGDERKKEIADYTVERAVADALAYHDACSLVAGLEEVALDQKRAADPGLQQVETALEKLGHVFKQVKAVAQDDQPDPPNPDPENPIGLPYGARQGATNANP